MKKIITSLLMGFFLVAVGNAYAGLTCSQYNGTPYCNYYGKIKTVYVNRGGILLLYTEETMDLSKAEAVRLTGVTKNAALAINMNTYPEFGKQMLSLALSAQMSGAKVTLQVGDWNNNGTHRHGGYFQPDRIWKH